MFGMSDYQLEKLSKPRILENGRSAWATWESERTSFGKTFRKLIRYPSFLPLFFSSDHYVDMLTSYRSNESNPTYSIYFTWNEKKSEILRKVFDVDAYHVEHPWLHYRRRNFPVHSQSGTGTLIFWPHSHDNLNVSIDFNLVTRELSNLPSQYHPLAVCISSHDVKAGLHKKLRILGLPIYTAGNINSQQFVDRFYTLLDEFKYAGGFYLGSHIYYCQEYGVPYVALDYNIVEMESKANDGIPDGKFDFIAKDYPDPYQRSLFDTWYSSLKEHSETVSDEQMEFAKINLGCYSTTSIRKIRLLVYRALLFNCYKIPLIYLKSMMKFMTRDGN